MSTMPPGPPQPPQEPQQKTTVEALSANTPGGNPRTIRIDPMDIQEEFQIEPEEGSTLADDDSYRTKSLQQLLALALSAPQVFNVRGIAAAYLKSVPGISPEEGLAPAPQPQAPPVKIGFNVTAKFEELSADVQAAILSAVGLPTEGTGIMSTVKHTADMVEHVGRAADSAAKLAEPAHQEPKGPGVKGLAGQGAGSADS